MTKNPTMPSGSNTDQQPPTDARVIRSRAKILAAATELLAEGGAAAITIEAVVERSGVAKTTLYRQWPSHSDLLVDVLEANIPPVPDADLSLGFERALRQFLRDFGRALTEPSHQRTIPALINLRSAIPELDLLETDRGRTRVANLNAILDLGVAEGVLPEGLRVELVAPLLFGPVTISLLFDPGKIPVEEISDYVTERFIASYRPTNP